jgi:hypothetical protein
VQACLREKAKGRYLLPAQLLKGALFPEMEESPGSLLPAHELKAWGFRFSILAATSIEKQLLFRDKTVA